MSLYTGVAVWLYTRHFLNALAIVVGVVFFLYGSWLDRRIGSATKDGKTLTLPWRTLSIGRFGSKILSNRAGDYALAAAVTLGLVVLMTGLALRGTVNPFLAIWCAILFVAVVLRWRFLRQTRQ